MNYAAILETAPADDAQEAPAGWNGADLSMDLAKPKTHVRKENLLVYTVEGQVDLRKTWAYIIWAAQGYPDTAQAATAGHLEAAAARMADVGAIHSVLGLLTHLTVDGEPIALEVRPDDALSPMECQRIFRGPMAAPAVAEGGAPGEAVAAGPAHGLLATVDLLWNHLANDRVAHGRFYTNAAFVTMMLCMNQMHRELCEMHNWYTNAATNDKTQTGRCTAMAGASKEAFMAFVGRLNRGHDMWHFLSNDAMRAAAYILVGKQEGPVVAPAGFEYNGTNIEAGMVEVREIVTLSDSVVDRLPSGTIGIAALILGVQFVARMLEDVATKVTVSSATEVIPAMNRLKDLFGAADLDRGQLLQLKEAFLPIITIAVGYMRFSSEGRERVEAYESITNFVKRDLKNEGLGATLAKSMDKLEITPDKLGSMVANIFAGAAAAINMAVSPRDALAIHAPEVHVPETREQKNEARAAREEEVRLRRMLAEADRSAAT